MADEIRTEEWKVSGRDVIASVRNVLEGAVLDGLRCGIRRGGRFWTFPSMGPLWSVPCFRSLRC